MTSSTLEARTTATRWPILALLDPHEHYWMITICASVALSGVVLTRTMLGWELWQAVLFALGVLAVPAAIKWRADARRYGATAAVAGALVTVQGLHTVEHIVQWWQRHVLNESMRASNGLLSPANSEWVHFVWNWAVSAAIIFLMLRGMRGLWAYALFAWAFAHTIEHTYMFIRYLQVGAELQAAGVSDVTAQGLPGILGAGGWLDLNAGTRFDFVCGMPFITTADRVDTHFAWNTGEMLLLLPAVHVFLKASIPRFGR